MILEYLLFSNALVSQSNHTIHNYNTRSYSDIPLDTIQHEFAKRYNIPILLNRSPDLIKSKIDTHNLRLYSLSKDLLPK